VREESVDLVYLDPPFGSGRNYNLLFRAGGAPVESQIRAFEDTWHWGAAAAEALHDAQGNAPQHVGRTLDALRRVLRRLWKCGACRRQFSVLTDTVMHGTKIPVRTWVFVIFEMCASKNGVSAREIERKYGLCPRSAWHLTHRIREAMRDNGLGMFVGTIVTDGTWIGGKLANRHGHNPGGGGQRVTDKTHVLSLVSRDTGKVRSKVVADVTGATIRKAIGEKVDMAASVLHTDSGSEFNETGREFGAHERLDHHVGEYVRDGVTTNPAENFFSQLKRSLDGTHHRVSREHLDRYLAEFDYRYSTRKATDGERVDDLMRRVGGRRLAYKPLTSAASS
jgi:transposase-like protein